MQKIWHLAIVPITTLLICSACTDKRPMLTPSPITEKSTLNTQKVFLAKRIDGINLSDKKPHKSCTYVGKVSGDIGKTHPIFWTHNPNRQEVTVENFIEDAKSQGINYVCIDTSSIPDSQFSAVKGPMVGEGYYCPYSYNLDA